MKSCWLPINPDQKNNYLASPGGQYAALLAVDKVASMDKVVDALKKQDFQVTASWQSGQPVPPSLMGNWLASLPPPANGRTWMYFELKYGGDMPKTIVRHIEKCLIDMGFVKSLCGTADISYVFSAQQVDDGYHPCGPGDPQKTPDVPPPAQAGCPDCPTYPPCPDLPPPCPGCPPPSFPWKPALIGAAIGGTVATLWSWRR
jgi:hypothetical protein